MAENNVKANIHGKMIIYRAKPYKTLQKPTYLPKSTPYGINRDIYADNSIPYSRKKNIYNDYL